MNFRSGLLNLTVVGVTCLAFGAVSLLASTATADATITAIGEILTGPNAGNADTSLAVDGEQVQIDVFFTNTDAIAGASFTAGIDDGSDFDTGPNGLRFDGGLTAATWFNSGTTKFGAPTGGAANGDGTDNGADNSYTSIAIPRSLTNADITLNGHIRFFSAFLVSVNGDGSNEMGILDGSAGPGGTPDIGLTSAGAAHVRLNFTVLGGGALLNLGMNPPDDSLTPDVGATGVIIPTTIQVPEPGSMALGLSAMASVFAVVGIRRRTD